MNVSKKILQILKYLGLSQIFDKFNEVVNTLLIRFSMHRFVVEDKWKRVRNYHERTVAEFLELFAATGCRKLSDLNRSFIFKQVETETRCYEDLYPTVPEGILLEKSLN